MGRRSSRKDPDVIVGKHLQAAADFQDDIVMGEFHWRRVEDNVDHSGLYAFLDTLRVSFLNPPEVISSVRKRYAIAHLLRKTYGCLDRTVPAAHHKNLFVAIVVGFDQAVHNLRERSPQRPPAS